MNNFLDLSDEKNQRFIASVICVLCDGKPVTVDLRDIEKFWSGEIWRLQYHMVHEYGTEEGTITFSLIDTSSNPE